MFGTNANLLEVGDIRPAFAPVDLNTGANNGDWLDMRDVNRVIVLLAAAIETVSPANPVFTLEQATDNAGTGAKALNFETVRTRTDAADLANVAQWTKTTQAASNTYDTVAISGGANEFQVAVEIMPDDLDVDGKFTHMRLTVPQVAGGVGFGLYIVYGRWYSRSNPNSLIG